VFRTQQRSIFAVAIVLALALVYTAAPSRAQTWPERTVRFLVTLGPGSGTDIGTRLLADRLAKRWGQPVLVENRPGGDGLVAISAFIGANDDHVLLASPTSSFTAHPFVYKSPPYKPADLQPIARTSITIIVIAVSSDLPVKSVAELVALARTQPDKLNWAGTTGALDFLFAGFLKNAGIEMSKVPYRNQVAANDLAAGRIQVNATAYAIVRPQLQAGKIKLLAVTNSKRAPALPDLPTVTEAGFPDLALDGLVGFFGPPTMPAELRERIASDVREAGADPVVEERLNATGQIPNFGAPTEFQAAIDHQRARIAAAAKDLGIVPTQ
jgi:tripartite-type tricarboxylate transporter receptor subunit TctC